MTAPKKILAAVLLLLLTVIVALYIIIQSIDLDAYKPKLTSQLAQQTGRSFEIDGALQLDPGLNTMLRISKLKLGNTNTGKHPYFITIETAEAEVELLPLINNELVIRDLLLNGVKVWLEINEDGQANWHFQDSQQSSDTETSASVKTTVSSVQITNTSLFYQNHDQPMQQLDIESLTASLDDARQTLHLASSLQLNNEPMQLTAMVGSVEQFIADNNALIKLKGEYAGKAFDVSTSLTVLDNQLKLDDLQIQLNGESLSGAVAYQGAPQKPSINADIKFDRFDLNALNGSPASSQMKKGKLFTNEAVDLSWINDNNLVFKLSGEQLVYNNWQLTNMMVNAATDKGKLMIEPVFGLGEGTVKGVISMDVAAESPLLAIDLSGNNILPGKISAQAQTQWIQQSKTAFSIKATSVGNSPAQLAANLKGHFFVDIDKGRIKNEHLDLVGGDLLNELFVSLNPASVKDDYTKIQCAVVNLRFKNGVAKYDKDIAAMTDKMMIISAGEINLKNETLDVGFSPQPRKDSAGIGINAGELVSVAKLTGKLTDPQLGLDAANTAKVGVKAYGAIATGGVSLLLDGLVSKMIADEDPCQTARSGNTKKQSQKTTGKKTGGLKSLFGF